jgi:hypothetical protein
MGKYRIKISYQTGDSFHFEDCYNYLELTWDDIDVAKENLIRIKEHYEMYQGINVHRSGISRDEWFKKNGNKDWFVNSPKLFSKKTNCAIDEKSKDRVGDGNWEYRPDSYMAEHCLHLITDNGVKMQLSAFWTGYFETLYSAEIELDESDMKITF